MKAVTPFLERLQQGILLADGAMGTMLYARGEPFDRPFELVNVLDREKVIRIHLEYIRAGAELIETNTFGGNRIRLSSYGLGERVRELNRAGAKIAKEARDVAGVPVFIAGSVGPLGKPIEPYGLISREEAYDAFREQIEALVEGGVDVVLLETFGDLDELRIAVRAAQDACDLPVIAEMTFDEEGRTLRGHTPAEVVQALEPLGVAAVGANCSVGPIPMVDVVAQMVAVARVPVCAMPNAGFPARIEGRYVYVASPAHLSQQARRMAELGARILGGCCGTTPEHIAAMAQALQDLRPTPARITVTSPQLPTDRASALPTEPTELSRKVGRQFVISVEVDPPKGTDPTKDLLGARMVRERGADVINVGDSPLGRVRMSAAAMCVLLQQQVGVETIIHFTTRDRNLMALQADLIGLHALGVRNILALTGDPPRAGDYPATAVYDTNSIGLVRILKRLNEGVDLAGKPIGQPTSFFVGVAFDMHPDTLDREMRRLDQKIEAGADFIMTQPIFEPEVLDHYLRRVGTPPRPMLIGILPLQSSRHAEFLHNEVPGIHIPEWVRWRMADAGNRGREEGLRLAAELLDAIADRIHGVYLMPSFGRYEVVAELITRIRARLGMLTGG